ncbi:HIT domain-containing protein [Vulcanisaeta souniana]|uniref:Hydrolase n=1 Tax=Vulcanisaeta souniana JCM 11219 TaxID=1293586 RepID=A0A830E6L8_9CREN|nr:HIT domain-containing protein [Vulcanisaeta souniana]BDR92060.1 hydrolase [Vulcanisaeta souniana JCM 11219]GGI68185.1 hydrolase [Vulcanisaeta souniana JCM 11219]
MKCMVCEMSSNEELIIMRNREVVVFHNPQPFNNGHLIIALLEHRSINEIDKSQFTELMGITRKFVGILQRVYNPHGFNIGISLSPHVYIQVVPRWNGDVSFMTLFYNVKVVPETVKDSVSRIKSAVREYGI